ncbi:MAG: twin-arginine translocation signal domain-containing protein [Opitutaceae bacterium]
MSTRRSFLKASAAAALAAPAAEVPAETPAEAPATDAPAPAAPAAPFFDTLEDAQLHLLTHARDKVVRTSENARFAGRLLETLPPGEIHRAVEGALERQRRFPLDTANGLRGRLRREHFTIFKKGSKGVSYVCAVKRKFRVPGQTFSDSIGALIAYIEANPMVRAGELPAKFLGIKAVAAPAEVAPAPAEGSAAVAPEAPAPKAEELSIDDRARLARLQGDLVWLVREGYVTEFIDGRLFAPPVMVEARKKEIEGEEHDPENFPEAPASTETPAAESSAAPAAAEVAPPTEPVAEAAPASPESAPGTSAEENPPAGT